MAPRQANSVQKRRGEGSETLYESDFYSWAYTQADLIRSGRLDQADLDNIAEEIEALGRSQLHALRSRYAVLCMHLLKATFQPAKVSRSWALTIIEQRIEIARLFADNPGLTPKREAMFLEVYKDGRKLAAAETDLALKTFPSDPSFTIDQAEDEDWRPKSS